MNSQKLYSNYKSYIYEIKENDFIKLHNEGLFVLFNPSIHYWLVVDSISKEIYKKIIELCDIDLVEKYLMRKYNISHDDFLNDVIPYVESLVNKKFLSFIPIDEKAEWFDADVHFDTIKEYPFSDIYISLSDFCNLNCIYCFNKGKRTSRLNSKRKEFDYEQTTRILKEFKLLGGGGVVFTGGEPTLNPRFLDLCAFASQIGLKPKFITNGLLLNDIDLSILFKYVDTFEISLDSLVNDELNLLWGTNQYDISEKLQFILHRINMWCKENSKKILINLSPIVTNCNKSSLLNLVKKANSILDYCNITWTFTAYQPIGNEGVDKKLEISENEYIKSSIKGLLGKTEIDFLSGDNKVKHVISYAFSDGGKTMPSHEPRVITCAPSFFITCDGNVYCCQGYEEDNMCLGNISENSLKEMYESTLFCDVRKTLIKNNISECKKCELKYVCEVDKRICIKSKKKNCKERIIQKMFLDSYMK